MFKNFFAVIAMAIIIAAPLRALEVVSPEEAGLNPETVQKMDKTLQGFVDTGMLAGGVAVLEHDGKVGFQKVFGLQSLETKTPMAADSIFRIFSMTKPIVGAALMTLFEEGKFQLEDPISKYMPEFLNMQVAVEDLAAPGGYRTVPAEREITVLDLMRHTAGFTYGFTPASAVDRLYKEVKILDNGQTLAEFTAKLAKLPLLHQPGTIWDYSVAVDVQGRLIEVLSGQTLDVFLQERIFEPLAMADTGFYVPKEKLDRFTELYSLSIWGKLETTKDFREQDYTQKPVFFSGGGGLVSTASDYLQFCRMMLNNGELNGKRILKEETVALMTRDHLGDLPMGPISLTLGMVGAGFGLDFAVTKEAFKDTRGAVGEYNWGGAASTYFWIDPAEKMIGIYMLQIFPPNYSTPLQFKKMSYDAIK